MKNQSNYKMKTQPTVKILVAYNKPATLLKSDILVPIHTGRAIAREATRDGYISADDYQWMIDNISLGDDTGENISHLNRRYCELTALYWAWKNYDKLGDPDYIGLMHYRRHLCFDLNNSLKPNGGGVITWRKMDDGYVRTFHLTREQITNVVKDYDIAVAEKLDVGYAKVQTVYEQYKKFHHIHDYEIALQVMEEISPQNVESAKKYNSQKYGYFTNCFVMRRELFHEFAQWLFTILFEVEKKLDISRYNVQETRVIGYIAERLFGIWLFHNKTTKNLNVLELKRTLVEETPVLECPTVEPGFSEKNIAVCLSSNQRYLPYLVTTIQSLIENASDSNNYDICILYQEMSLEDQNLIKQLQKKNILIRFVNVKPYFASLPDIFQTKSYHSINTYNRFFIPLIFKNYDKLLYLDCDLVVKRDVAKLYETELDNNSLAAVIRDRGLCLLSNVSDFWRKYVREVIGLDNVKQYFNAGVLLMNVRQMVREDILSQLLETLEKRVGSLRLNDQDVMNIVFKGRTSFLDVRWNVESSITLHVNDWMQKMAASDLFEYLTSRGDPWIVHYCGHKKPWNSAYDDPLSTYFWHYARKTPFYETILYEHIANIQKELFQKSESEKKIPDFQKLISDSGVKFQKLISCSEEKMKEILRAMEVLPQLERKLRRIRMRILFSVGKKRRKLIERKRELKILIRDAKETINRVSFS